MSGILESCRIVSVDEGILVLLEDLARRVLHHASHLERGVRFLLGIAGPPGAGKSTLALTLRDSINQLAMAPVSEIASMDGFHLYNHDLRTRGWIDRKGEPTTFDVDRFVKALRGLQASRKAVSIPTYDRNRHDPTPDGARFNAETRIVIAEGTIYCSMTEAVGPRFVQFSTKLGTSMPTRP